MNSSADESTMVPSPGLELVLCADWESLVRDLAGELAEPPADPFASRLVVLDAPAARRDLSQQLAVRGGGICAGVDFAGLRQVRRRLEEGLLGIDAGTDQWRPRGLALAVLDVMDASVDEPWFVPIAEHLGVSVGSPGQVVAPRPGRRLAVSPASCCATPGNCPHCCVAGARANSSGRTGDLWRSRRTGNR